MPSGDVPRTKLTMVSFLPLVLDQGYHKIYRVLGSQGCNNKNLGSTNAEVRILENSYSWVKIFTLVNVLREKTKTNSQFRISGLMNSKIEVSGLRYPEIKQKRKHTCEKWIFFESEKVSLSRWQGFRVLRFRKEKKNKL